MATVVLEAVVMATRPEGFLASVGLEALSTFCGDPVTQSTSLSETREGGGKVGRRGWKEDEWRRERKRRRMVKEDADERKEVRK